jgi:hypothetical protein
MRHNWTNDGVNNPYDLSDNEMDTDLIKEIEDDLNLPQNLNEKKRLVQKKLEEQMEKKRLRYELDDYEQELDDEFDWDKI